MKLSAVRHDRPALSHLFNFCQWTSLVLSIAQGEKCLTVLKFTNSLCLMECIVYYGRAWVNEMSPLCWALMAGYRLFVYIWYIQESTVYVYNAVMSQHITLMCAVMSCRLCLHVTAYKWHMDTEGVWSHVIHSRRIGTHSFSFVSSLTVFYFHSGDDLNNSHAFLVSELCSGWKKLSLFVLSIIKWLKKIDVGITAIYIFLVFLEMESVLNFVWVNVKNVLSVTVSKTPNVKEAVTISEILYHILILLFSLWVMFRSKLSGVIFLMCFVGNRH